MKPASVFLAVTAALVAAGLINALLAVTIMPTVLGTLGSKK